jgi:hypothetical protein
MTRNKPFKFNYTPPNVVVLKHPRPYKFNFSPSVETDVPSALRTAPIITPLDTIQKITVPMIRFN